MADSLSRDLAHGEVPLDLILEILPRLPAKSLLRFQSVSKLWFSIIRSKDLAKSFLTYSKTRPRLLFSVPSNHDDCGKEFVFSAPEHDNNTSSVIARHDMTVSSGFLFTSSCGPVNGFFCCLRGSSIVVCNPTTKQIVKLPDVPIEKGKADHIYVKLGYDPVEDQYKVLCVTYIFDTKCNLQVDEYLVCTVRSGEKEEWRKIVTNPRESYPRLIDVICIDGVIYFAFADSTKIARFDVRTEKFDFIQGPQDYNLTLINCNGNLGGITHDYDSKMHLWIMEKEECAWNYMTYDVSTYEGGNLFGDLRLCIVGEIHTKEVMLVSSSFELCTPTSIHYCDLIRKSFRRAEVLGLADQEFRRIHGEPIPFLFCFPGHIENIMFL